MSLRPILCAFFFAAFLGGCTTAVESNPARTATEQLLISTAAERASAQLALAIPYGSNVFIDSSNFEGTDSKYALGTIRTSLLKKGVHLMDDKKNAQVIIEARAGALSTDRSTFLIGTPQFNIPIPFATSSLPFPEIALYKSEDQKGVAKFAITGYDAQHGTLLDAQDPQYGISARKQKTFLIFFSWTDSDDMPDKDAPSAPKDVESSPPT